MIYEVFTSSELFIAVNFKSQFLAQSILFFWLCFEAVQISESQMLVTNADTPLLQAHGTLSFTSSAELTRSTLSTPYWLFDLTA